MTLGEDASQVRSGHAPQALVVVRITLSPAARAPRRQRGRCPPRPSAPLRVLLLRLLGLSSPYLCKGLALAASQCLAV